LIFLERNNIGNGDIERFTAKVEQMYHQHYDMANAIKEKARRIGTLTKHLEQYNIYAKHSAVYQKYRQLDPKKQSGYAEKYAEEIRLYKEPADYFKAVMNGRTELPIKKWKTELATLTDERYALCDEYYRLDDELRSVEALKRGAENIIHEETRKHSIQGFEKEI